ncbi:SRPBCC family protein [Arthrobacter sp. 35W]|uniref:SRPBCC family protein n=1 Tax=Arthrobacter sp. 35W TaxID=1132441 RepID=UPI0004208722|nr:SRPBCC family protein [Arthrobacter sp. 35W]
METTTHGIAIDAPASVVFEALRDSAHWASVSGLTIYKEQVDGGANEHTIRISVVIGGELSSCLVARTLDPNNGTIFFQQVDVEEPLQLLIGEWTVADGETGAIVTIQHDFEVSGDPDIVMSARQAIDDCNRRELDALKLTAEWLAGLIRKQAEAT